jgi:hypothetical protein
MKSDFIFVFLPFAGRLADFENENHQFTIQDRFRDINLPQQCPAARTKDVGLSYRRRITLYPFLYTCLPDSFSSRLGHWLGRHVPRGQQRRMV